MYCAVIMPVYNEAPHLNQVLQSFAHQRVPVELLILVDDGSTDESPQILNQWAGEHSWIELVASDNKSKHAPGQKVVNAFNRGLDYLQRFAKKHSITPSLIGKFDADVVLPDNYIAALKEAFVKNHKLGLASGHLYINKNNEWVYEQIAKKHKVRGPIKLYRKTCFDQIGGFKPCLGWDSIDQWLVQFWDWEVQTFPELKVHHLKATGQAYNAGQLSRQGSAFAHMGYGFWLSFLSLAKLSIYYKQPLLVYSGLKNYWQNRNTLMVTKAQAKFIRKRLWKAILNNR